MIILPNEILLEIFAHLSIPDQKNIALINKRFQGIANSLLWRSPKFRSFIRIDCLSNEAVTSNFYVQIKPVQLAHMPIRFLNTGSIVFNSIEHAVNEVLEHFKSVVVFEGIEQWFYRCRSLEEMRLLLKYTFGGTLGFVI